MNRNWKDNYSAKIKKAVKKHKFLKCPLTIWLCVVIFFYDLCHYFSSNSKRFASVLAVVLFFITGSSFSFVGETDGTEEDKWSQIQESYEYVPTVLNESDDALLEEQGDLLEDYDYDEEEIETVVSLDDILAESGDEVASETATPSTEQTLSKDDWQLILVNKQHPIPDGYEFTPAVIKGTMKCDSRILGDLKSMMKAAKADGISLVVSSSYRDYSRQTYVFNRKIDYYMEKGYSYLEAYKLASLTVTIPDASEHQIGLALDITSSTYSALEIGFGDTNAGKWLAAHCAEYGFILRYPLGKEEVTGIQYEPWHFRYVGKTAAAQIMEREITLEEFVSELE
jgi:D-alanyl-D-alanine carboxypeptidase